MIAVVNGVHVTPDRVLKGKTLSTPIRENIVYADLNSDRSNLYMLLLTAGYLKAVKTWKVTVWSWI